MKFGNRLLFFKAFVVLACCKVHHSFATETKESDQHKNLEGDDSADLDNHQKQLYEAIAHAQAILHNPDQADRLAKNFMKGALADNISEGDVKKNMKKFSKLLQEEKLKPPTPEEMFKMQVKDIAKMDHTASTYHEFRFCKNLVGDIPELLTTNFKEKSSKDIDNLSFVDKCEAEISTNPVDSSPWFVQDFKLCDHLYTILKLHLQIGLPDYVHSDTKHFCTFFVDSIFPIDSEPHCMLMMDALQLKHAVDNDLPKIVPYPYVVKKPGFKATFDKVCVEKALGDLNPKICHHALKDVEKISDKALKNGGNMTIFEFTNEFCTAIGYELPHPGNHTDYVKDLSRTKGKENDKDHGHGMNELARRKGGEKRTARHHISKVFSVAQGYKHGIVDRMGKIIERPIEDRVLKSEKSCDCPPFGGVTETPCYYLKSHFRKARYNGGYCCSDKCYETNLGAPDSAEIKRSACSGRAYTSGWSHSRGIGPLTIGGGFAHGYGIWLDGSTDGSNNRKWAEQDFEEHCMGVGLFPPTDLDDWGPNIGLSWDSGYVKEFGNINGFSKVETISGSALIFSSSISTITCCQAFGLHQAVGCSHCGSGSGLGIFFPPSWFDVDYDWEACYAYPSGKRNVATFNVEGCDFQTWRLVIDCGWNGHSGPYHMIKIEAEIWGGFTTIHYSSICVSGDSKEARATSYIDFPAPDTSGGFTEIRFSNHLPGQLALMDYFSIRRCPRKYSKHYDWLTKRYERYECRSYDSKSWGVNGGDAYHLYAGNQLMTQYANNWFTGTVLTWLPRGAWTVSQQDKCEGVELDHNSCLDNRLVENGEGCYWNGRQCKAQPECSNGVACPRGHFCNHVFGYSGFCEPCDRLGRRDDCTNFIDYDILIPKLVSHRHGQHQCENVCFPSCSDSHPCSIGFCNFDNGSSGFCESCFTTSEHDCRNDDIPARGVVSCIAECTNKEVSGYNRVSPGCVAGHNIMTISNLTPQACGVRCNGNSGCRGFEYYNSHAGSSTFVLPNDCRLQSGTNTDDCDAVRYNMDMYIKE